MKKAVYYFTATGNTLVVAKDLAIGMGGAELIPIVKALKSGADAPYDTIGIVFPVYMFGLPLIVADFVKKIKAPKGAYIFAVANYGGLAGRPLASIKEILASRGMDLSAGFGLQMPGNYAPLYGAIGDEGQKSLFSAEKDAVKRIAAAVNQKKVAISGDGPFIAGFILNKLLYKAGSSQIPSSDTGFWITDKCVKCGLCDKICPVSNIVMKDGHPSWMHRCQHCMACLQWCPVSAIQYKKSTEGKKRYHHPDVSVGDIIAQK